MGEARRRMKLEQARFAEEARLIAAHDAHAPTEACPSCFALARVIEFLFTKVGHFDRRCRRHDRLVRDITDHASGIAHDPPCDVCRHVGDALCSFFRGVQRFAFYGGVRDELPGDDVEEGLRVLDLRRGSLEASQLRPRRSTLPALLALTALVGFMPEGHPLPRSRR